MKKILFTLLLAGALVLSSCAIRVYNEKTELVATSAPQAVTSGWVDLGSQIEVRNFERMALWVNVDINSTNNVQFRVLYGLESAGNEYQSVILSPGSSDVKFEGEYLEYNVDADGRFVFEFGLMGANYAQVQVKAGTVGATAGQIDEAYVTLSGKVQ